MSDERSAAVCLVERAGRMLCVWNRRYHGWMMPGGMKEPTDVDLVATAIRELEEESGLKAAPGLELVYEAPADPSMVHPGRATQVSVFRVTVHPTAMAEEREHGCPIAWLTREEFLDRVPFRAFYTKMFRKLDDDAAWRSAGT